MIKVIEKNTNEMNKIFFETFKGLITSFIISSILILIISIILTYTDLNEKFIPILIIVISAISVLIGGMMSSYNVKRNGIINGGGVGTIYVTSLYIISSIINNSFELNAKSIAMIITSIGIGIIGGIIGVNLKH